MSSEELQNLRQKLIESMSFPSVYMYKFIVETDNRKIALVESLFGAEADIHTRESENRRYISITAKQVVMSVDEIMAVYEKALEIKGIIFL
jgi:uncharacterized protein